MAALGALAGCPGTDGPDVDTPDETPVERRDGPDPDAYDTVVDITEAGADPDGEDSIVPTLSEIDTTDTLVRFPPGTYHMGDTWGPEGAERLGLYGPEATITTVPEFTGPGFPA